MKARSGSRGRSRKAEAAGPRPIGVFDSGLGGLTVVREIRKRLPQERVIYFGDLARLPYGTKSPVEIQEAATGCVAFLKALGVKKVVVACSSAASAARDVLARCFGRGFLIDVIEPTAEEAVRLTRAKRVGVLGTPATVESNAYGRAIQRLDPAVKVFQKACPLFVPLVEEGWFSGEVTRRIAEHYLKPILARRVDVVILGCTHYPLLKAQLLKIVGTRARLIDSAPATVRWLEAELQSEGRLANGRSRGGLKVYLTDRPRQFKRIGRRFLGERLPIVERTTVRTSS